MTKRLAGLAVSLALTIGLLTASPAAAWNPAWPPPPTPPSDPCDASGWDAYYQRLIADATSEGDLYAAASAAQDMRAKSAWIQTNCGSSGGGSSDSGGSSGGGSSSGGGGSSGGSTDEDAAPGPDMCEYRGVMMTCSEAWNAYQQELAGTSSPEGNSSAGAQPGSGGAPRVPSEYDFAPSATEDSQLLSAMRAAAATQSTLIRAYEAALAVWVQRESKGGPSIAGTWLYEFSKLARTNPLAPYAITEVDTEEESQEDVSTGEIRAEVRKLKRGTKLKAVAMTLNGDLKMVLKTSYKPGTRLKITVAAPQNGRFQDVTEQRIAVDRRGILTTTIPVTAWNYIWVRDPRERLLARLATQPS